MIGLRIFCTLLSCPNEPFVLLILIRFVKNQGGAIRATTEGKISIFGSQFKKNSATLDAGGAVALEGLCRVC